MLESVLQRIDSSLKSWKKVYWVSSNGFWCLFPEFFLKQTTFLDSRGIHTNILISYLIQQQRHPVWWRHQMEKFSALLAICAGNSPVAGEFPSQRPVRRSFDVFYDLRLNTILRKQSWGWWFETLSRPLWRQCNGFETWSHQSESSSLWRHQIGTFSALLALCEGNPPVTTGFPSHRTSNQDLWCSFCCYSEQTVEQTFHWLIIRDILTVIWRHRYVVTLPVVFFRFKSRYLSQLII